MNNKYIQSEQGRVYYWIGGNKGEDDFFLFVLGSIVGIITWYYAYKSGN